MRVVDDLYVNPKISEQPDAVFRRHAAWRRSYHCSQGGLLITWGDTNLNKGDAK